MTEMHVTNVAEPLLQQARERGAAPAIIAPTRRAERTITFAELERESARLAARLRRKGVGPGDRVLVMINISIELYVALTALLRAGMVAMFLDPASGRAHIQQCCKLCPPVALLGPVKAQLLKLLQPGLRPARSMIYPRFCGDLSSEMPHNQLEACNPDTPALLTFTSGSTATPKAAVRTHGLLAAQQTALTDAIDLQPGQMDLATLPVFVLANLAAGMTTILPDADLRRPGFIAPDPVLDQITRHHVTRSAGSPAFYERLAERCEQTGRTLAPLRTIYTGGAPVFGDLLARLDRLMPHGEPVTVYGSTEAEPIAHIAYHQVTSDDHQAMSEGHGLLVGPPVEQIALRIVDVQQLPAGACTSEAFDAAQCETGAPGEILVTGDHVLKGYVDPADDTETKLHVDSTVWHRTGDAGYLDATGRLWLLGRMSAIICDQRGTVYPFAIECAARQVEGVAQAAVAAIAGERVLAVELHAGADQKRATEALRARFDAVIDQIIVLPEVPMDARHNAKVRYPELRECLARHLKSEQAKQ